MKEGDSVAKNLSELHDIATSLSVGKDTRNEDLPITQQDTASEYDEADDDDFVSVSHNRNAVVSLSPPKKKKSKLSLSRQRSN